MNIFKRIALGCLFVLIISISYIFIRYSLWYREFFSKNEDVVCTYNPQYIEEEGDINIVDRIENFIISYNQEELMTFTKSEILHIIKDSVKSTGILNIQDMCLLSQNGVWRIYTHAKLGFLQMPWIGIDMVKDNRQTTELYSNQMYLGDIEVPSSLANSFLRIVNKGISDAIVLIEENGFLGRNIKNVDLLKDSIVFKGGF